jgi:tetratricopeptide (TPR) repeat protein
VAEETVAELGAPVDGIHGTTSPLTALAMRLGGDMKSIALFFLLLTAISFYGCATIIHGATQDIPVVTDPPGATAKATNGHACTTPCSLTLQTKTNHVVTISKAGYESVSRQLNFVLSDAASGAQNRLVPEMLIVQLSLSQAEKSVETAPKGPSKEIKAAVQPEENNIRTVSANSEKDKVQNEPPVENIALQPQLSGPMPMPKTEGGKEPDPKAAEWAKKSTDNLDKQDWSEVIRTASVAISIDPSFEEPYLNRGFAYYKKGFLDESISDCSKVIELNPRNGVAYNYRALTYAQKGLTDHALRDIEIALGLQPRSASTFNSRGVIYQKLGKKQEALSDYRTACDLKYGLGCENYKAMAGFYPADIPKMIVQLLDESKELFGKADWDGVIGKCSQVIELAGSNATAYANRAGAYANKKMLYEASRDCEAAIKINPNFALSYNNRGYVRELSGWVKQAVLDYETACKMGLDFACRNVKRLSGTTK